jgi:hypothetical protein
MFKRDYLSSTETNDFLTLNRLITVLDEIVKNWGGRKFLQPDEQKQIKTASTNLKKFENSVMKRISDDEYKRIEKRVPKYDALLVDRYTYETFKKKFNDPLKIISMDLDEFLMFASHTADVLCKDCISKRTECQWYKVLERANVKGWEDPKDNCPFAY